MTDSDDIVDAVWIVDRGGTKWRYLGHVDEAGRPTNFWRRLEQTSEQTDD